MRSLNTLIAAFAVSLCVTLTLPAQTTVSTVPVGFNTATVPAAPNASTPASTVISAPFYQIAAFQGAISGSTSNTVSFTGTTFTTTLPASGVPYLARFKTGNSVGRFFAVLSYTDTTLTLDTTPTGGSGYALTTGTPTTTQTQVANGDSVEITSANTLNTLFPSGAPFGGGGSASAADTNVLLFNGTTFQTYFYNNTVSQWRRSGSGLNQNNTIVFPDQGMFVVHKLTSAVNVTFLGSVPSTTEKTDFPGAGSSFKANRFPIDMTLGTGNLSDNTQLNLNLKLAGWHGGTSASNAGDNILLWNGTTWSTYYYNTTNSRWQRSGSGLDQSATTVPLGTAMFVVRTSTATGSNSTLTQSLPYNLN